MSIHLHSRRAIVGISLLAVTGICLWMAGSVVLRWASAMDRQSSPPRVELGKTTHDFGTVDGGTVWKTSFDVRNRGGRRLILRQINGGCGCLVPQRAEIVVEPDEVHAIAAQFNAGDSQGSRRVELRYRTNDPLTPTVSFFVLADVRPATAHAQANPASADLTTSAGQSGAR
jgi:hypothetical protein